MPPFDTALVWFRRDLRDFDHAALYHALKQSRRVFCAFIFDKTILQPLLESGLKADRRVEFIHASLLELDTALRALGGGLIVRHAEAAAEIPRLAAELGAEAVFINHDFEPQAAARDAEVAAALSAHGRQLLDFKDHVIFEKDEVLTLSERPFSIFTPYKNAWLKKLHARSDDFYLKPYPVDAYRARLAAVANCIMPSLEEMGFERSNLSTLHIPTGMSGGQQLLQDFLPRMGRYDSTRNFPAVKGPSYLSIHLRFGTVSIRTLARHAVEAIRSNAGSTGAATWLSELIWRDFYCMILHHHPRVAERAFKPEYDAIRWESGHAAKRSFEDWCAGATGYPLVDAAMMQLNQTGYMHNRLRMVTACFLIKDLGIDWRWGERYFAQHLNDFDLAANNGGWQWAASTGCDAQPYFRIFNPVTQSEKFDPEGAFIRRYLPQLSKLHNKQIHTPWLLGKMELALAGITLGEDYPNPIVQHDAARKRTLERYAVVKKTA
ncbi:MAG: deoxyribodipyrimidine photo-lyase [Glaciimonas sp.]|nr:deoxyribodipyrimidine photo-lyase [Glaciimonas sp.]